MAGIICTLGFCCVFVQFHLWLALFSYAFAFKAGTSNLQDFQCLELFQVGTLWDSFQFHLRLALFSHAFAFMAGTIVT